MAAASSQGESLSKACNYYKVANLTKTILGASEISNLKDGYVLGEELGLGQFGVIRECSDKITGEVLACKSIARSRLSTADDIQSIKLEIEIMTRLSGHPNVVALKEVYEDEDYVHLVMELCAGGELFNLLEKHGRFSESDARLLFRQLMQVVLYCHNNGVVHRDLKPENILLATKTSLSPIKLADFGLATYIRPGQSLRGTVGSPFYIAPEVLAWGYNQSADVWSAGVILYILLSGMPPFWGKTKSQIFDAVRVADLRFPANPWDCISASAKSLIKVMLCKDPCQRLTAKEVLDHFWMKDQGPNSRALNLWQDGIARDIADGKALDLCISRDQDISFGSGAHIACEAQSPTFTCRSSLSSLVVEQSMPFASDGFSFRSCGSSDALKFCSLTTSMPSFTFLGPSSINELSSDSYGSLSQAAIVGANDEEMSGKTETKRVGGINDNRILGIHNKRNRTIGVGEREQLDFIVEESVIRWSSCTLISTSLRSSPVF